MSPKNLPMKPALKKALITIAMKKETIQKYEEGERIIDIANEYSKASSTITTIIKEEEDIKGFAVSEGVTLISSKK